MKKVMHDAFTIVEVVLVITIIGILSSISTVAYVSVQKQSRDSTRESRAKNIASALEKYYKNNGEYPGCMAMTQSASLVSSNVLTGLNSDNLSTPTATSGTNSIHCTDMTNTNSDVFSYVGDGTTNCSTGSACSSFTLKYISEDDSTVKSISSKHNSTNTSDILFQNSQGQKVTFTDVSTGYYSTCALTSNNKIYCWGYNSDGQLGNGTTVNSSVPVAVDMTGALSGKTIIDVSASYLSSCALTSEGKVYCWGKNDVGELGNGTTTSSSVPVAVTSTGALNGKTVTSISSDDYHTCALTSDGKVYCWGVNTYGQLGNNTTTNSLVPVAVIATGVLSGKTVKQISAGYYHNCALTTEGKIYCWGYNNKSQLGNNNPGVNSSVPVAVDTSGVLSGETVTRVAAGKYITSAIASTGEVFAWGYDNYGQLGYGVVGTSKYVPNAVTMSGVLYEKISSVIDSGGGCICTVSTDGQVFCWGDNEYGQLGDNSLDNAIVPTTSNISSVTALSIGYAHVCTITNDGNIYCWGENNYGQVGNNSTTDTSTPTKIDIPQ